MAQAASSAQANNGNERGRKISISMVEHFLEHEKDHTRRWLRFQMDRLVEPLFNLLRDKFVDYVQQSSQSNMIKHEMVQHKRKQKDTSDTQLIEPLLVLDELEAVKFNAGKQALLKNHSVEKSICTELMERNRKQTLDETKASVEIARSDMDPSDEDLSASVLMHQIDVQCSANESIPSQHRESQTATERSLIVEANHHKATNEHQNQQCTSTESNQIDEKERGGEQERRVSTLSAVSAVSQVDSKMDFEKKTLSQSNEQKQTADDEVHRDKVLPKEAQFDLSANDTSGTDVGLTLDDLCHLSNASPIGVQSWNMHHSAVRWRMAPEFASLQAATGASVRQASANQSPPPQSPIITLELQCVQPSCSQMFASQEDFDRHLFSQHSHEAFRCLQRHCNRSFGKREQWNDHLREHTELGRDHLWMCGHGQCAHKKTQYNHHEQLYYHHLIVHQMGRFQCSQPGCKFVGPNCRSVYSHYYRKHKPISHSRDGAKRDRSHTRHGPGVNVNWQPLASPQSVKPSEPSAGPAAEENESFAERSPKPKQPLQQHRWSKGGRSEVVRTKQESRIVAVDRLKCLSQDCAQMWSTPVALDAHMYAAHGVRKYRCAQRDCSRSFHQQSQLDEHLKEEHADGCRWQCGNKQCVPRAIEYRYYSQLAQHTVNNHQLGRFRCAFATCHFVGATRRKVYTHYYNRHKKRSTSRTPQPTRISSPQPDSGRLEANQSLVIADPQIPFLFAQCANTPSASSPGKKLDAARLPTLDGSVGTSDNPQPQQQQRSIIVANPMHQCREAISDRHEPQNYQQRSACVHNGWSNESPPGGGGATSPESISPREVTSDCEAELIELDESDEEIDVVGNEEPDLERSTDAASSPKKARIEQDTSSGGDQQSSECSPIMRAGPSSTGAVGNSVGGNVRKSKNIITVRLRCLLSECSHQCETQAELDAHMAREHPSEMHRCLQKGCSSSFHDQASLWRHIEVSHAEQSVWQCGHERCASKTTGYGSYLQLYSHTAYNHHLGVFRCAFAGCSFSAESRKRVYGHHSNYHPKRSFCCRLPGCGKEIKIKKDLIAHEHTHLGIKPYRCGAEGCTFASAYRHITKKHIRGEHIGEHHQTTIDALDYLQVQRQWLDPDSYGHLLCPLCVDQKK